MTGKNIFISKSITTTSTESIIEKDIYEWKKQLITKDDYYHIHKSLGILCLLSFIFRYCNIGTSDMGFISYPELTVPTLLLHFMLTASAFTFTIPMKRIKDGTRIWPEYRMHAMVFLCRSIIVIYMYHYEEQNNLPRNYNLSFIIVILTMVAADICTLSVDKKYRSKSVQELDTHPAVKFFFSFMQFLATTAFLIGLRRYSFPYMGIAVVQLTPFLGTLRRKNLINANFGAFMYGVFLLSSYIITTQYSPGATIQQMRITACLACIAAIWRMTPMNHNNKTLLQNKYLLWITLGFIIKYIRPQFDVWTTKQVNITFICCIFAILLLGYYKVNYGYNINNNNKMETKKKLT